MTKWRNLITEALREGDTFQDLIIEIDEGELDREFNPGFGSSEGSPFTAWSHNWVYFPVTYDGYETVESVPRNPCKIKTKHLGGE